MAGSSSNVSASRRGQNSSKKKTPPLERRFKDHVLKVLKANGIFHFVKEAGSIRGIPDIVGCSKNGIIFMWELKRAKLEVYNQKGERRISGRAVLQDHWMAKCRASGGIADFVYPENLTECLAYLLSR